MAEMITVNELVSNYTKFNSVKAREEYLKKVIVPVDYVPFEIVGFYADRIIATTFFDKDGNVHVDSCKKYLMHIYTLLKYYVNLDVNEESFLNEYNTLHRIGLVDAIIEMIPKELKDTLDIVINLKADDAMVNNYSIQAFLDKQLLKLYPYVENSLKDLIVGIEGIVGSLNNVDNEAVKTILTAMNK